MSNANTRGLSVSIDVYGVEKLEKKFGKVSSKRILEPPMRESLIELQDDMRVYPPERPRSRYIRTGRLRRAWIRRIQWAGRGLVGRVSNQVPYARYVQARAWQAWFHQGWWTNTTTEVLDDNRRSILRRFRKAIREALR